MRNHTHNPKIYSRLLKKMRKCVKQTISYAKLCRDLRLLSNELRPSLTDFSERGWVNWDKTTGESGKVTVLETILESEIDA